MHVQLSDTEREKGQSPGALHEPGQGSISLYPSHRPDLWAGDVNNAMQLSAQKGRQQISIALEQFLPYLL